MDQSVLINQIIDYAAKRVSFYKHDYIDVVHLFLSFNVILKHLGDEKSDEFQEEFREPYKKYSAVREKYNIKGDALQNALNHKYPSGRNTGEHCSPSPDFQVFMKNLELLKAKNKELTLADFATQMFSDKAYGVYEMIAEAAGSRAEADKFYDEVREIFTVIRVLTYAELDKIPYLTNLNQWVIDNPRTVIGADDTVKKIYIGLCGRSVTSVALVGKAGCGKTEVVYKCAQDINSGNCPDELKNCVIYSLDPTGLVAGAKYRGETEQRLLSICQFAKEHKDVILFIDEVHQMVGLGNSGSNDESGGGSDILKPFLSRGDIRIIGATTDDEYTKNIMRSKAFARRLFKVNIQEPDREQTKQILMGLQPTLVKFFNREIVPAIVEKVLEFADRYNLDQANPAKSLGILELAMTYAKLFREQGKRVDIDDILKAMSLKYDIHISDKRLDDCVETLHTMVLGQDKALDEIIKTMKMVEYGVVDENRPLAVIMLAGPTGTGKTFSCELIAERYFGHRENLIKINCAEFTAEHDVSKLIGSPPGYVGHEDDTGILRQIKQRPNSLVLFDEIEKAHPNMFKVIMNMLDKGSITDNKGDEISFKNALIVFTTNLGTNYNTGKEVGAGFIKTKATVEVDLKADLQKTFRPEFLGRIDKVITYDNLTNDVAKQLIDRYLKDYNAKLPKPVKFTKANCDHILSVSDIITEGARNIRKKVKEEIITVIESTAEKTVTVEPVKEDKK